MNRKGKTPGEQKMARSFVTLIKYLDVAISNHTFSFVLFRKGMCGFTCWVCDSEEEDEEEVPIRGSLRNFSPVFFENFEPHRHAPRPLLASGSTHEENLHLIEGT